MKFWVTTTALLKPVSLFHKRKSKKNSKWAEVRFKRWCSWDLRGQTIEKVKRMRRRKNRWFSCPTDPFFYHSLNIVKSSLKLSIEKQGLHKVLEWCEVNMDQQTITPFFFLLSSPLLSPFGIISNTILVLALVMTCWKARDSRGNLTCKMV